MTQFRTFPLMAPMNWHQLTKKHFCSCPRSHKLCAMPDGRSSSDELPRGCSKWWGNCIANNHCALFFAFLLLNIFVAMGGIRTLSDEGGYSENTDYDWSVNGALTVDQNDMVRAAEQVREGFAGQSGIVTGRRRLHGRSTASNATAAWPLWLQRTSLGRAWARDTTVTPEPQQESEGQVNVPQETGRQADRGSRRQLLRYAPSTGLVTDNSHYSSSLYPPYLGWQNDWSINFMYRPSDGSATDVFTPERLQTMCEIENVLMGHPRYGEFCYNTYELDNTGLPAPIWMRTCINNRCCIDPARSVVSLFYKLYQPAPSGGTNANFWANVPPYQQGLQELYYGIEWNRTLPNAPQVSNPSDEIYVEGTHSRHCQLLDATYVSARAEHIFSIASRSSFLNQTVGFHVSQDAITLRRTTAARSFVQVESGNMDLNIDTALQDYFGQSGRFLYSPYRSPAERNGLTIKYWATQWIDEEFDTMVQDDFLMVPASVLFVFCYMAFHTRTLWLALFGMLMILLSVPMAMNFYLRPVPYFSQLHNLAVFIVLGVGADDIFVFTDAFKQTARLPPQISGSLPNRIAVAYKRASGSIFNTSFTTAVAFLATAVSPVMPLGAFGIFSAIAIMINYFLVCTWWPCVLVVWEGYFRRAVACECCCKASVMPLETVGYGCSCCCARAEVQYPSAPP